LARRLEHVRVEALCTFMYHAVGKGKYRMFTNLIRTLFTVSEG